MSQRSHPQLLATLPRMYALASSLSPLCPAQKFGGQVDEMGQASLELWAVTEAAKLCAKGRLRTSFGGPMQTFEALEHVHLLSLPPPPPSSTTFFLCRFEDADNLCRDITRSIKGMSDTPHTLNHYTQDNKSHGRKPSDAPRGVRTRGDRAKP